MSTRNEFGPVKPDLTRSAVLEGSSAYRWRVLALVWSAFVLSCVDRYAWGTIAAPVGQSLGISVAMLGAFSTAFYLGYAAANLAGGPLTDLVGGRTALLMAMLPLGVATFCFGYVHTLAAGVAVQILMGLASGADYCAGLKLINAWFGRDKGRAIGIFATATSISIAAANAVVPALTARYGWATAFHALGIVTAAVGIVAFVGAGRSPKDVSRERLTLGHLKALSRNRDFILLSIAGGAGLWGTIGFVSWANALLTKHFGFAPAVAGSVLTVVGVAAFFSKPLIGWASDLMPRYRRHLAVGCLSAFAIVLVVFGFCSTLTQFYLVAPLLGIAGYGYLAILIAQITNVAGATSAGSAAGISNAFWQLGGAIAPIAVGYAFASSGSFLYALMVVAIGPVVAAVTLLFMRCTDAA
ncbi:MFS transporter [Paraburkholderia xenovorans]|uniref:MFS transporter n=1 Tax=Paraburkholderia xenovorans TaxID=36873 RepID=UPI001559ACCC|nr:MFS transporter [Paraburkholderia xenovorans]NPT38965.1 MFS transporter [Paraburkholderia xenovorans]